MSSDTSFVEIACQQVMLEDASVFSVQWTDLPTTFARTLSAQELLTRYLSYVKKFTLTLIRPVVLESSVEFRLIGTALSLISFLPPVYEDGFVTLRICGGFLVQPRQCERGELRFGVEQVAGVARISLQLSEFCPLILGGRSPSIIRFWLYRFTQAAIHRLVTIRFLSLLYHELVGPSAGVRIVNVAVRSGKAV